MASTTTTSNVATTASQELELTESNSVQVSKEEMAAKAVHKRYEGLVMVRNKAIKGKGAWYWAHLEPVLVHSDSGQPKAAKLRCLLCDSFFSASNPSRTASEHLKRGTCPNFNLLPKPISSVSPSDPGQISGQDPGRVQIQDPGQTPVVLPSPSPPPQHKHRKRNSCFSGGRSGGHGGGGASASGSNAGSYQASPVEIVDPTRLSVELAYSPVPLAVTGGSGAVVYSQQPHQHSALSGGKEDLNALAMFEDSVKKLKSPKASPGAIGLPPISQQELGGERLDAKYEAAKAESEAKIRDAMFFQIASNGWKSKSYGNVEKENLVNLALNLPNGTSVFRRSVFTSGYVTSKFAEEVLWKTILEICANNVQLCVGIVADKFKAKALRNLENQHHWMVNLSCQFQGFNSLIKDLSKELPIFKNVTENSSRLAIFINSKSQVRNIFYKYQLQVYGHAGLLRVPPYHGYERLDFGPVYTMMEDILSSARALELMLDDESYKIISMEEPFARDVEKMMRNPQFWNEMNAVHSLVKLIKAMAQGMETERLRVGQCLPLWEELRIKVKDWCSNFKIGEGLVERVIERRFRKNYHPAWAAAYILDPLYLVRESSGKYLPPFKCLTPEQEKDVDKLIIRLVSREEAHIALMELMKWRTEGLDPLYAQAVQLKQRDPMTGKMKIINPHSSRLVWETYLSEFKSLGKVAVRLIFLHATSFGFKCNVSLSKWASSNAHSREGMERAQKLLYIAAHSKLEKRDFSQEEDKDVELFTMANGEDEMPNDVYIDTSTV
ncbi:uncharacterized protein LOC141701673 isoform X2 [Apium graveolens]|uniref:DUF7963 domain-containing protein n=1 Tax=Apium graveolens TaxID=4045 RepID=A0A6L5B9E1_APIGR|nr:hypothetical protein AG4045_023196 [Apium graveolens]